MFEPGTLSYILFHRSLWFYKISREAQILVYLLFFSFSVFNNPLPSARIDGDDLGGEREGLRCAPRLVL